MFKKYMCLALCLLMALGTMSTTASAASAVDALTASYVSFSDANGPITDLPASASTVKASVTVSNNSASASSVVLWVGKYVDEVLTDIKYTEAEVAAGAQNTPVSVSMDNVAKDEVTSGSTTYDRTVLKAYVWTGLIGGRAIAPIATLPSDDLSILYAKKNGEIWTEFDPNKKYQVSVIDPTEQIPQYEFFVNDNATKLEAPAIFGFGDNEVALTSAKGNKDSYTFNFVDGSEVAGAFLYDNYEEYTSGAMNTSKWGSLVGGYLNNTKLLQRPNGNTYVSLFGTDGQQYPRLEKHLTDANGKAPDYNREIIIKSKAMIQDDAPGASPVTADILARRALDKAVGILNMNSASVKLFGVEFGKGITNGVWFNFEIRLKIDPVTYDVTATAVLTGDGLKDKAGQPTTELRAEGKSNFAKAEPGSSLPIMFNTGNLAKDNGAAKSINYDDTIMMYAPEASSNANIGSLTYTVDGTTNDVTDFEPNVASGEYTISVPTGTDEVTLNVEPYEVRTATAEVYVNGEKKDGGVIALAGEPVDATIKITAQDGTVNENYTVHIIFGGGVVLSKNAKLSALTYQYGDKQPETVPGFSSADEGNDYGTITLPSDTKSVTVGATTQHEKANAVITLDDGTPVTNGVVAVSRGTETVVKVTVTPEDTTAKPNVYTVAFKVKDPIVLTSDTLEVGKDIVLVDEPMSAALPIYTDRDGWVFTTLGAKIKESNFFVRTNARTTMEKYAGSGDMFSFVAPEDGRLYLLSPDARPTYADAGWKLLSSSAPVGPDGVTALDKSVKYTIMRDGMQKHNKGDVVDTKYWQAVPYNFEPSNPYYASWAQAQTWNLENLFRDEIAKYEAGALDYVPIYVENDNAYGRDDTSIRDGKSLHYCYSLEFKQGDTVKVPFFGVSGAQQDPPFLIVNWGVKQVNTTSYVLDETNATAVSANSGDTVGPVVIETSADKTYEYAKGFNLAGISDRTYEYIINGDGKNKGYKWTLSGDQYTPGQYLIYAKGTGLGGDGRDSFFVITDEKTIGGSTNTNNGVTTYSGFNFPAVRDADADYSIIRLNWVPVGTITVPENGSTTLRLAGRENPIVDKLILISVDAEEDYTIEKAEAKHATYYNATFKAENGDTLATVEYDSGLVGTAVPTEAYIRTASDKGYQQGLLKPVDAFVVPEKEGMIAAWKPATLQADGTTFVPEYTTKPTETVLFSDDFEGYTDLFVDGAETAVPDTRKWTGIYKYNTLLKKDGANTYASLFTANRPDNGDKLESNPRMSKELDYSKSTIRISGKIMRQNGTAKPAFTLQLLATNNGRISLFNINNTAITLFDGESIGKAEAGKWISYDYYLTFGGNNGEACSVTAIFEGEGLTDMFGNATNRIVAQTTGDISKRDKDNKLNFYFNTNCGAQDAAASINLDDVEIAENVEVPAFADNAKLSSLTYTTDKAAAAAVPGFDPANEGGAYTVDLPAGTTSVKLEGVLADVAAKGGVIFNGQALAEGTIAVTDGSSSTVSYVVVAENGKTNRFDVTFKVAGEVKNRVTNLKTASAQGVYTDNEGYIIGEDKQTSIVSNGKYAVMDGLIPGVTTRYGTKGDEGRKVDANTNSYFEGATIIKAARGDRNSSPAGKWATQKYYSSPDYDGKDGHGYWLEFTVSDDCTVFQVARNDGKFIDVPWINAPADWTKTSKSGLKLDGSNNIYYKEYKAGETVQIPNYGVYDQWTNETDWYEAPGWYIVWADSGKVNPDTLDGNAKLSALTYQFDGETAATAVPNFDPTNEGGNYDISIPAGKSSVTVAATPASVGKTEVTVKVSGEVVPDGVVTLSSNKLTIVEVTSVAEDKATTYTFTITFTPEGLAVGEVTDITQAVTPSDSKSAVRADTIVFGTTSPYVRYSKGEDWNANGTNAGAAIYTADNAPAFFEGATAVRRDKNDGNGSNLTEGATANYWGKTDFNGKEGNGYWLTFKVSEAGTVYVVDREGKGWPNKPDGWNTSKFTTGGKTMYYKKVAAGETVQIPNYGWDNSWTKLTTGKELKDPSYYVVVWGAESPEDKVNSTANLTKLQYQVGSETAVDVPDFSKTDEGKPEGYKAIELPEGTTEVKVLASAAELATYVVKAGGEVKADGVVAVSADAATEVLVEVTSEDKTKTNTFKLTFTVAGAAATETVVIYDNFEDYGDATTIDKSIKGWVSVKEPNISLNRSLEPGNTVAEVKKVDAEQWPSLHKHITAAPEDIFVISGKVRLDSVGDVEPSHYLEMRDPVWPHTTKRNTLSISSSNISILDRKIAEGESGKWITYKMYMIRGAVGEKTQYIVELTGEGLKDASGNPTERVVAANAAQLDGLYIQENEVKIMFNHNLGNSDDTRVYLDELKIAKVDTAPDFVFSNDAKLQSLTYAPNGENVKGVEDFSSTDEGKPEGYASIELPYGTTTVTVGATPVKGAWYVVEPKDKELPDGVVKVSTDAATDVRVVVTSEDGMTTNTFKLTFTVSNEAPPEKSKDATLKTLTYQYGSEAAAAVPGFTPGAAPAVDGYKVSLPEGTAAATIAYETTDAKATVAATLGDGTTPVADGSVDVSSGSATVIITVTPEDETAQKNVYTVVFEVEQPPIALELKSDRLTVGNNLVLVNEPIKSTMPLYLDRDYWPLLTMGKKIKESNLFVSINTRTNTDLYVDDGSGTMFSFTAPEDGRVYVLHYNSLPTFASAGWSLMNNGTLPTKDGKKITDNVSYTMQRGTKWHAAGTVVNKPMLFTLPYNYTPNNPYYAARTEAQSLEFREEIQKYEAGELDYIPSYVESNSSSNASAAGEIYYKNLSYCYALEFKKGETVKVPYFVAQGQTAQNDPPLILVNWGEAVINRTSYVLDETNGALKSEDKSGITMKNVVLQTGENTYEFAKGMEIGGVGAGANRNQEYVINGEGQNIGYIWTLSSEDYAPGDYNVYVKGTSYGSDGKDSFYIVYDEKEIDDDAGINFNAPPRTGSDRVLGDATVEHIALNWKKGAKTITIPENGSVTVRVLGREGGAFVEKVMLLSNESDQTPAEAEAAQGVTFKDAKFTSESGDVLATVKYDTALAGTMVPGKGTYLDTTPDPDVAVQEQIIAALNVPEKVGFTGAWSPDKLAADGTTFAPVYTAAQNSTAKLSSLQYQIGSETAVDVPGFAATDDGKPEGYTPIELPEGTAAVKVLAEAADNAAYVVKVGSEVKADGVVAVSADAATEVLVEVTSEDGTKTNTFKLTFTVAKPVTQAMLWDDFEGYGNAEYPDNSKWDNALPYKNNLKFVTEDSGNKYLSIFGTADQKWPRIEKNLKGYDGNGLDFSKSILVSSRAMLQNNETSSPSISIEARRTAQKKVDVLSISEGSIKLYGTEFGKGVTYGKWFKFDITFKIDPNTYDVTTKVVITGEGLKDMSGDPTEKLTFTKMSNFTNVNLANDLPIFFNTANLVDDAGKTTVNFDNALMDYTADIPDMDLKSLTYNGVSVPNFSAATTDYIIYTMTADPVTIAAEAKDTNAQVSIDKSSLTPTLEGDKATVTVTNGDETVTYTVTVMLMPENKVIEMKVASNRGVYDNGGTDLPGYAPATKTDSKYMISENLQVGALGNSDRNDKGKITAVSDYFLGATYIRPRQNDAGGNNQNPIFTGAFDGKGGNPYWLEFTVSSAATVYYASCNGAWTNKPAEWNAASATDDLSLKIGSTTVSPANGNLYSRHYEAGERVQIPNFGATSNAAPWESPAHYIIVWDSDKEDPDGGIDDGGEHGTGNGGGWEDGGNN